MTSADQNLDHEEAIRARARAIWERVGRPDGKDIEHWRQAEEEIAAELRFRLVVEAAPNAMVMVNRAGAIVMVNAQAERVFGYPRAELLGQPVEMLVPEQFRGHHPELREAFFIEPLARPMGAGRDLFGLKKDGSEFPVEIGLNPIETDGETMVLPAIVDITERKRLEERLRLVVEAAPNAMVMVNRAGEIVMVNAQTERVLWLLPDRALLGQRVEMLAPPRFGDHHSGLREMFSVDPQTRPMGAGRDLYGLKKDGSEFPVEIGLNPIETDEGTMVLSAIVDITERKAAEAALKGIAGSIAGVARRVAPRIALERNGANGGHGGARIKPAAHRDQQLHGGDRGTSRPAVICRCRGSAGRSSMPASRQFERANHPAFARICITTRHREADRTHPSTV